MSIYQKRWSSVGTGASPSSSISRNTPTATNVLSSGVEPSTVGTSWNSVRWNKPSTSYRASLASRFENNVTSNSSYTPPQRSSRFLSSAAKNAADVASIGPSVSARASRFDSTSMANKEKYRNEARELINKWSSRERNSNISNTYRSPAPRSTFRSTDSLTASATSAAGPSYTNTTYRTSTSLTPTRPTTVAPSSTASRYSTERASLLSPSPTPILHTTPKADRPWRQRMAESSRIRSTLGDDVSQAYTARRARHVSSRRSSLSQDELSSYEPTRVPSYSALVQQQPHSYRSRQSSVESSVFSPSSRFTSSTTYVPYSYRTRSDDPPTTRSSILDRSTSRSKSPTRDSLPSRTPSQAPKNPSIRESSKERDSEKQRKKSVKERTARRNSRQNSQQDSSSDEEINRLMRSRSGSQVRRKPRKKSQIESEKLVVVEQKDTLMSRSMQSSLYETGAEDSALIQSLTSQINDSLTALAVAAESEGFQSCAASPLAPSISRSSSKNGVVKNQIIRSPSLIEVLGLPRSDSKTSLSKLIDQLALDEETHDEQLTFDDFEPSESSRIDDESQYSAVAHFKPNKIKRLAPVPGLWKSGAENEEFISRNKRFAKSVSPSVESCMRLESPHGEAEKIILLKNLEKISKNFKVPEKKKPVVLKTKVEPKPEPAPEKKTVTKPKEAPKAVAPAAPAVPDKPIEAKKAVAPNPTEKPKPAPPTPPAPKTLTAAAPEKPKTVPATPVAPSVAQVAPAAPTKPVEAKKEVAVPEKPKVVPAAIGAGAPGTPKSPTALTSKLPEKPKEPVPKAKDPAPQIPSKPAQSAPETIKPAPSKPKPDKIPTKPIAKVDEEKVLKSPIEKVVPKVEKPAPVVVEKPKEVPKEAPKEEPKEAPKPGIEKKKVLLKKKKIIPIDDEKEEKPEKPKALPEQNIEISKVFSKKSWGAQKTDRVLKMRNEMKGIAIRCKAAGDEKMDVTESYRRKPQAERATVLVDTPVPDVNFSTVKISLREKRKRIEKPVEELVLPPHPPQSYAESENMSRSVSVASRASDTRASIILDEMRGTEAAVEWTRDLDDEDLIDSYNGILVLPDKSILEQYISRKRGKIDRYRGLRPSSMVSYASSSCASPCPSTVSELCLPSSVLVHEPRRRAQYSAEPDHCVTPVPLNSTPRGFTTKKEPPPVIKPVPFEAPKTLFEKMIQDQANRNRTTATSSETRDPSPRRGSQEEGMSAISQQFAAAAAAGNGHGSVRYAAHIPVRNGEVSGRVSTGSVDSQQSGGTLDVASKNIDHVIDQARHRHHQHRSKFKEAIDYLDQIFEDLKKECDPDDKNNNDENNKPLENQPVVITQKPSSAASFVAVKKKPTTTTTAATSSPSTAKTAASASDSKRTTKAVTAVKPTVARQKSSETTGSTSSFSTVKASSKPIVAQAPSPVEVVIPVRKISQGASSNNQPEPTVAETIVLAKKTDKMDFTRRWLQDDLQSLAHLPPANIAPNASYYQDFDEHSLGSCSAEVAAFNTTKEKKNGKSTRKVSDSSDMVRPRPFRPQPVYPMVDGYNGPSAFEPFSSHTLPRVASNDQIPSEMKRSGSQDPYNTLRSMRSEGDGFDSARPSPSAFQQVSPFNRGSSMRSSLRSLPDHSPVRQRVPHKNSYEAKDPVLSIDQLVAELELNTENTFSAADKRRSFPTSFGRPQAHQAQQHHVPSDYEKPNRYRAEMRHVPTRGRAQNFVTSEPAPKSASIAVSKAPVYSQPVRQQQQQKSLDEVTSMLNRAVSQFGSDQRQAHQHPSVYKQLSQQSFGSVHSNNAFETINQEKINPSRVEAMHNMFERGTAPTSWKMQQPKEAYDDRNQKMSPLQEVTYATLNSYSPPPPPQQQQQTNGNGMARNSSQNHISFHDYTPQLPTTQPPQRPPGSANSSQGGYYSSNSSGIGSNYPQNQQNQYNNPRRSLIIDQQSISSRMPSVENDDDDGFYDNIGIYDDRRYSRGSELENSASFRQLPPASNSQPGHKHNRIGSFLRKIGGVSNRPPGSAASLMSLNKISNETIIKPGGLMKSNSLSNEPWKKVVLGGGGASMPREANNNHKAGLGTRLKNSLFGSRKRLDG